MMKDLINKNKRNNSANFRYSSLAVAALAGMLILSAPAYANNDLNPSLPLHSIKNGTVTGFAGDITPTLGENSVIEYSQGTESDYNFKTTDTDGNSKYYKINLNTGKMTTQSDKVEWSEGAGDNTVTVKLPNETTPRSYHYSFINGASSHDRVASLSEAIENAVFAGLNSRTSGGAIYNDGNSGFNISADFIRNYASAPTGGYGGAIYNKGSIGDIAGNFIGNYSYSSGSSNGGVICNVGTIGNITGDFIGNYSNSYSSYEFSWGGAIYNYNGTIGNITGDFISNYSVSPSSNYSSRGGAVYIANNSTIGDIMGDFIGNYVQGKAYGAAGGAIYNYSSTIADITGNFIGNYAQADKGSPYGGAIENKNGIVGDIRGDFIGNYASTSAKYNSGGGAIDNESVGTIGNITGNFIGNYASTSGNNSYGGAIYNNGAIGKKDSSGNVTGGIINSNFIGNYVKSTSSTARGGAIWTSKDLNIIADNGTSTFKDNYVQKGVNKENQAIWVGDNNIVNLNLNQVNGGNMYMYDKINGINGYKVNIQGDGSGTFYMYNDLNNANVKVQNTTINTINNEIHEYIVKSLDSDSDSKWYIDIDVNNAAADSIKTAASSSGRVVINGLNFFNGSVEDILNQNLTIQVLKTQNDNLQLELANNLSVEDGNYVLQSTTETTTKNIGPLIKWSDILGTVVKTTKITGDIGLATTDTTNDSIGLTVKTVDINENRSTSSDVLKTINTYSTTEDRTFEADSSNETYTATEDAGENAAGNFTVQGVYNPEEQQRSTIDFNNHKGFELNNDTTTLTLKNVEVRRAKALVSGTAGNGVKVVLDNVKLYDNGEGITTLGDVDIKGDSEISDKVEAKAATSKINIEDGEITLNNTLSSNGTISNNGKVTNNSVIKSVGQLTNNHTINTNSENLISTSGIVNNGTLNFNSGSTTVSNITGSATGDVIIDTNNDFTINNRIEGSQVSLNNGILHFGPSGDISQASAFNANGGTVYVMDNKISETNLGNVNLNGKTNLSMDFNLKNLTSDTFQAAITNNGGMFNVNKLNLTGMPSQDNIKVHLGDTSKLGRNNVTSDTFDLPTIMTPIKKMAGRVEDGYLMYASGNSSNDFNPAVLAAPVAAQFGGYLSQLNSYDEAFRNLDMKMLMTREERQALRLKNSYASAETPKVFSPIYLPEKDSAGWFRPYATFEKVDLKNGPKVSNVMYGSYFGGDSQMYSTKNGWDYQYSVYVGYNGSHQAYSGNDIYQNGGTLGATGVWYKDNFFTALTANVGASVAEASTMYGSEDFPMLMTGVATKSGYNWELANGKFIIQPNYLMSYTFVNTFDYTNGAGVKIKSDPLHAINIVPGVKFIGNLKNGWQPYASVQMVWNIMDKTDFRAANVNLPEMSVKPYVQYGVGLQKRWGDRFTGYLQTMIRNGGRNGVALSLGFRWAIEKESKTATSQTSVAKRIK